MSSVLPRYILSIRSGQNPAGDEQGSAPGLFAANRIRGHGIIEDGHRQVGRRLPQRAHHIGLLSAVNNRGAVSPLTRATASKIPVISPALAARKTTCKVIFQRGAPRARAASRRYWGPGAACLRWSGR